MRVGIQLPEVEREVRWPEYLAMAKAAEEVGFDSIWVGDHLLYDEPDRAPWEVWTLMSALAAVDRAGARSGRSWRAPASTRPGCWRRWRRRSTRSAAGASCSGSARAGTGASSTPSASRTTSGCQRFEEAFAIIRGLLAGERVTLDGSSTRPTTSSCCRKPARQMPLMIGSNGPRMLGDRRCRTARLEHLVATTTATRRGLRASCIDDDRHPGHRRAQRLHARPARRAAGRAQAGRCRRSRRSALRRRTSGNWARPAPTR